MTYQDFADRLTSVAETISTAVANDTVDLLDWQQVATTLVEEIHDLLDDYEDDTNDDDAPSIRT